MNPNVKRIYCWMVANDDNPEHIKFLKEMYKFVVNNQVTHQTQSVGSLVQWMARVGIKVI